MLPNSLKSKVITDDDVMYRLQKRSSGTEAIGILTAPSGIIKAWSVFLPSSLKNAAKVNHNKVTKLIFLVTGLPDGITQLKNEKNSVDVIFSGYPMPFPAKDWTIISDPDTLPTVEYTEIEQLVKTEAQTEQKKQRFPAAMRAAKLWLCSNDKRPISPAGYGTDPTLKTPKWDFETCLVASQSQGYGMGFSISEGFACLDLDHVLDDAEELKPEYTDAMQIIRKLNSYTEVSRSGNGIHVFFHCRDIPDGMRIIKGHGTELYTENHYIITTGNVWKDFPTEIRTITKEEYEEIHEEISRYDEKHKGGGKKKKPVTNTPRDTTEALDDNEVINLITNGTNEKAARLWIGDISGYPSPSEADAALMAKLAFYTGGSEAQMERLFRMSGLGNREKVVNRPDYVARQLQYANNITTERYHPKQQKKYEVTVKKAGEGNHKETQKITQIIPSTHWQDALAQSVCKSAKGKLPNIRDAGGGLYAIIDPQSGLTQLVANSKNPAFHRWCYDFSPHEEFDAKYVDALWYQIVILKTAGQIKTIDIKTTITRIPCKNGWISLETGQPCETPEDMEYCPFVLNLTVEEAAYNPNHNPKGRIIKDLMTYLGKDATEYLINLTAASIPRIPANRRVTILTGKPRSSKTTMGKVLGLLGLAPLNVDFSSETNADSKFRPQIAMHITRYPTMFINDPEKPDANAVKKFIEDYAQYQLKGIDQFSVFQRASVVMTMNEYPEFKTSGMNNKIFFIRSEESFVGNEIPDDEYLHIIQSDGSLVDIWQAILRDGIKKGWKIVISPESEQHNENMCEGATPYQRWLSRCKRGGELKPISRIYEHCILYTNPDTDGVVIVKELMKYQKKANWTPTDRTTGFSGTSRSKMKMDLRAIGIPFSADGRRAAIVLPYIDRERDPEIIHEQIELEETKSKQRGTAEPDTPSQLTKSMKELKADPESAAVLANIKKHGDNR